MSLKHRCRTQTWLPDAAKAGTKFIQDFYIDKIIFSDEKKTKAIGVEGTWGAKIQGGRTVKVIIKAKKVIISGGSIHSPAILIRSGLTASNSLCRVQGVFLTIFVEPKYWEKFPRPSRLPHDWFLPYPYKPYVWLYPDKRLYRV